MPFLRPTLSAIRTRVKTTLSQLLGLGPLRPQSNLAALAEAVAGQAHAAHGSLDFLSQQIIPSAKEAEFLEGWAEMWGLNRKAAEFAQGPVLFTGTNSTSVPAQTQLRRGDGVAFETVSTVVIAAGVATVDAVALEAGLVGDTESGSVLVLSSPIPGLNGSVLVSGSGIVGGADTETDVALFARLRSKVQDAPRGGSPADYKAWALEVGSVTRAFAIPNFLGAGTVGVAITVDDDVAGPIPGAPKVAEVQAYIDDESRRPLTADVTVFAPTPVELNPRITLTPDDGNIRLAVTASLEALLLRESVPGGTVFYSQMLEAVSNAEGEVDSRIIQLDGLTPGDKTVAAGELLILGAPIWDS